MSDYPHLHALPTNERARLADALAQYGRLPEWPTVGHLKSVLPRRSDLAELAGELADLADHGITGRGAAQWLRTTGRLLQHDARDVVLAWSGPEVPGLPRRDTGAIYEELVARAQRRLWICSFAYHDGLRLFASLGARMDETPALDVTLQVNVQRQGRITPGPGQTHCLWRARDW